MLTALFESARSYERNTVTVWNNQTLFTDYNFERTATIVAKTTSFSMHNLEVWNTDRGTQSALAIAAGGNKQAYYGVAIRGHRSVLQANDGDQYYSNCYSEGSSSYIWGNAAAWFDQCTIASNATGYIADSTRASETDIGWYVEPTALARPLSNCWAGSFSNAAASSQPLALTSRRAQYGSAVLILMHRASHTKTASSAA